MQVVASGPIRVALVAPPVMCWALQQLVSSSQHLELVGSVGAVADARQGLAGSGAHVVVVDYDGCVDAAELIGFVSERLVSVIVFTGAPDLDSLDNAILAGLKGIVRKSESPGVLLNAIEKVHQGELWIDRSATSRLFIQMARQKATEKNDPDRARVSLLTQRERQAIAALASDTSAPAKVIASRMCISEHTLRNHLTSIYSKLHLTNRLDLYAYATRHHLDKLAG
jgi:two-component system nitrate/nitrite response regulator NarL